MRTLSLFTLRLFAVWIGLFAVPAFAGDTQPASGKTPYNPTPDVMHHIGDAHQFHIVGDLYMPLPCMAYSADGFFFAMSSAFQGNKAVDGYVIYHDQLMRIKDPSFPKGVVVLDGDAHGHDTHGSDTHGTTNTHTPTTDTTAHHGTTDPHAPKQVLDEHGLHSEGDAHGAHGKTVSYQGKTYELEAASALQGMTSWHDFSITKNVFSMLLGALILMFIFSSVSSAYKKRAGQAPKGMQSFFEIFIVFMRDEVIVSAIGPRWEKYFPFLMTLFFFILINNLMGLVPFFPGSSNVTGNMGVTMVLAIFAFLVTNLSGNRHYWQHIFWMPGVPAFVKVILTPLEVIGLFIKPITLLIRLFANITAGHIMILSLTSLIFVFSNLGESVPGAVAGGAISLPFVFAMNFLELFVAFLQSFIFVLLTSLYIGSAVEEHHHEEHHAHEAHH